MGFKKVDVKTLEMKPFEKIGSEWMLISAAKDGKANTMTASWGGIGVLWGKNVATVYIRPQRHTKEFVDAGDTFTISFFGGEHMKERQRCPGQDRTVRSASDRSRRSAGIRRGYTGAGMQKALP